MDRPISLFNLSHLQNVDISAGSIMDDGGSFQQSTEGEIADRSIPSKIILLLYVHHSPFISTLK